MEIKNAKYIIDELSNKNGSISATIDGEFWSIPISEDNRHYAEILKQVADGDLTIADAD